jgi:hypothetical protein
VFQDIFVFSRHTESQVGVDDSTDIKDVLNCKFHPLVDAVPDKA